MVFIICYNKIEKLARKGILDLMKVEDELSFSEVSMKYGIDKITALNCNENLFGVSPKAVKAMQEKLANVNFYPQPTSSILREKIAQNHGIDDDMVIFGNGADNILLVLAQSFINEGDEYIIGDPSFFVYQSTAAILGGKIIKVPLIDFTYDLNAIKAKITPKTKIIMICNPNNPTGTIVTRKQVDDFMADVPDHCIVVFDEAYAEFVMDADYLDSLRYVKEGKNVIIIKTLSKILGFAGMRVGYAIGHSGLIDIMRRAVEYFPVNYLAQVGASAAIEDVEFIKYVLDWTTKGKEYLYQGFAELGCKYIPTYTNFIFVDLGIDADYIYQKLLAQGILIRPGKGWGLTNYARITIGTMEDNRKLISVLGKIFEDYGK